MTNDLIDYVYVMKPSSKLKDWVLEYFWIGGYLEILGRMVHFPHTLSFASLNIVLLLSYILL